MKLKLKVIPGSSRDSIAGWLNDALKIKVRTAPEQGKANKAVEKLLASALNISPRNVDIISGHISSHKVVNISGIEVADIYKNLPVKLSSLDNNEETP